MAEMNDHTAVALALGIVSTGLGLASLLVALIAWSRVRKLSAAFTFWSALYHWSALNRPRSNGGPDRV